jgi:flagellar export protein FliJ
MKAFSFRLEQVKRWRETELSLQESRVAAAAAQVAEIRRAIEARRRELDAARVTGNADGADLRAYADFRQRTEARIRDLEGQAVVAQRTLATEMNRLVEANRKVKLIENLKQRAQSAWTREFDRELSAFADEAFLNRYNR